MGVLPVIVGRARASVSAKLGLVGVVIELVA